MIKNETLRKHVKRARDDPTVRKRLRSVTLVCLILISAALIKPADNSIRYYVNSDGELIAIERDDNAEATEFTLCLTVEDGEDRIRTIRITPGTAGSEENAEDPEVQDSRYLHDAEISAIIGDMEVSDSRRIELPDSLSDGTMLHWSKAPDDDSEWMILLFMYLILILVIIVGTKDLEEMKKKKAAMEIVKCIPRFTNQFLLLLNAGLIVSDAFMRIRMSYELIPEERRGLFEKEVILSEESCVLSGATTSASVAELAVKYNVKELMRIATFMSENEKRGSDILESLSRESQFLWDERKASAKEEGKSIDTRMAYPLAFLLILLIVITMAPAILTM